MGMDTASSTGLTVALTSANSLTTTFTAKVFLPGLTVANTRASTSMIKNKAQASSCGPMVANTKENGEMESNTEQERIFLVVANHAKALGKKANVRPGLAKIKLIPRTTSMTEPKMSVSDS